MSGDRRIQIIGNIPLPASLAEAGRLQVKVGEAVDVFAAELRKLGIPGEMECKVVSARPKKAAAPTNGAAQRPEATESEVRTAPQPEPTQVEQPNPAPVITGAATPSWVRN